MGYTQILIMDTTENWSDLRQVWDQTSIGFKEVTATQEERMKRACSEKRMPRWKDRSLNSSVLSDSSVPQAQSCGQLLEFSQISWYLIEQRPNAAEITCVT